MNALSMVTRDGQRAIERATTAMASDRRVSRRGFLSGLGLGVAAAASVALPSGRALAARRDDEAGLRGVEMLHAWARGEISRGVAPAPMGWALYVPVRGAAFVYPPEWTVTEISDPDIADFYDGNPTGALVVAPDETAGVLMTNVTANAPTEATDAAWAQLEQIAGRVKLTELVEDELPPILQVTRAFVAARAGDMVYAVLAQAMPDSVMGGTFLYFSLVAGPADEFDDLTEEVFLPVLMSQVTGGPGGGGDGGGGDGGGGDGGGGDDDDDDDDDDDGDGD